MRTIDLVCKLCSPIVAGVVLQFDLVYPRPVFTALFIGLWNLVSFFGELGLLLIVYRYVPTLAKKKLRTAEVKEGEEEEEVKEGEVAKEGEEVKEGEDEVKEREERMEEEGKERVKEMEAKPKRGKPVLSFDDSETKQESANTPDSSQDRRDKTGGSSCYKCLGKWSTKLLSPYLTIRDGWRIFIRQDVARVGFSMASLYLTVLGLNGITATYFLTQGIPEYAIGVIQGIGGFVGILGTVFYPWVRSRVGTVRTGLIGSGAQLSMLFLCVAAVFSPGISLSGGSEDYYSPKCPGLNETLASSSVVARLPIATPSSLYALPTLALPSVTADIVMVTHTPIATPMPSLITPTSSGFPGPSPAPSGVPGSSAATPSVSVAVILMALGVVLARFGLWMYDLVVSQLVQETVEEEHRGVVSGVMSAMNSNMDMLQYVLVLGVPSPAHFGYLTLVSVFMVTVGFVLYLSYVRKVRGHLFHFNKYCRRCGVRPGTRGVVDHREELRIMSDVDDDDVDENNGKEKL